MGLRPRKLSAACQRHAACRDYHAAYCHPVACRRRHRVLPLRRMPLAAAVLMCEPRGASGRRSRRKSPRTDKALPTRQCSDFNAPRAARHTPQPMPLHMPQPSTAAYCRQLPPLAATAAVQVALRGCQEILLSDGLGVHEAN